MKTLISFFLTVLLISFSTQIFAQDSKVEDNISTTEKTEKETSKKKKSDCRHYHAKTPYRLGLQLKTGILQLQNLQELRADKAGTTYSFGLMAERYIAGNNLTIQTGAELTNEKMEYLRTETITSKGEEVDREFVIHSSANYLTIPIGIRYRTPLIGEHSKSFISASVDNSILVLGMSSKKDNERGTDQILPKDLSRHNIGLTVGGGMEFALPNCKIASVGLQYKSNLKGTKTNEVVKTSTYQLQFGFYF